MERKNWVDWAKALGILLVVMGHSSYSNPDLVPMIFMIHMPLFYVVSGYLFKLNLTWKDLLRSSFTSLILPYILYNIIFALFIVCSRFVKVAVGGEVDWSFSFWNPLWHFLLGIADGIFDGPTWFLLALVWCRMLTYLFHKIESMYPKIIMLGLLFALMFFRMNFEIQYPYALDCGIVGFIWFEIGVLIKKIESKVEFVVPVWLWLLLIPMGLYVCMKCYLEVGSCNYMLVVLRGFYGVLGTAFGLIAFFGVCFLLNKVEFKWVVQISKASIIIMCLHMLVQGPLNSVFHYQNQGWMTFFGDLLIVLILAYIYPIVTRKMPALTGSRK